VIRFYLDTDDDFDVAHGLDISEEIISWESRRAADGISRAETDGILAATVRRGRALASWWRAGRLLEARVDDDVFFRGFLLDAIGAGDGQTRIRAATWLQHLSWRGRTPGVVGLSAIDALRSVVNAAADGFPGASRPSAALIEQTFAERRPRRLYWGATDRPLFWGDASKPLYWRYAPDEFTGVYEYLRLGDTDVLGDRTLFGPPPPAVAGESAAVVDRLTAVEYSIENYEYGLYRDEVAVLAAGEIGWVFSGGEDDIAFIGRAKSAAPPGEPMAVSQAVYGRYAYAWQVGEDAVGQVVGRQPDVQESRGVIYRQENVIAAPGVSSWNVSVRDRGRPVEVAGDLRVDFPMISGVSIGASAAFGDLLIQVFNNSGGSMTIDWIEVSGTSRVYQGGLYGSAVTGRYGGRSVELRGVFGGAAGLSAALDYWSAVLGPGGLELRSVTLDGRRFRDAWRGELGGLLRADALAREGMDGGPDLYWIVGVRGSGAPEVLTITYDLMRYEEGS